MKRLVWLAIFAASSAHAAARNSVVGSKHDFSVNGPGPIKATAERQVCIFCHVSHGGGNEQLTNRPDIGKDHRPYESTTIRARPGAPTGASRLCLSCHDGTIAVGKTLTRTIQMDEREAPGGRIAPTRHSNLGTDLRKSHPISFAPSDSEKVRRPANGDPVHLDRRGELQCTSCHDAHAEYKGSPEGKFLTRPTRDSELCVSCHSTPARASHFLTPRQFGAAQGNEQGYGSVAQAGCKACHRSHGADTKGRLLMRREAERDDAPCLRCHSGAVAGPDIASDMSKPYSHAVDGGAVHDAVEGRPGAERRLPEASPSAPRHAVCVDCHDPHEATGLRAASAPDAGGALAGVWGIDAAGRRTEPARYEYEICFKCHADSANKRRRSATLPRSASADDNLRRVFDPGAASYHPVVAPGRNPDVPSLRRPYTTVSHVYCTDCHSSDSGPGAGGTGARGPHGSVYPPLLERSYVTADPSVESPAAYALCYKCHDRDVLLSDRSAFRLHRRHVVDERSPCSACHSAHGVSALAGNPVNNAHLIDFDTTVVQPNALGARQYVARGSRTGSCSLTCHGKRHDDWSY